MKHFPRGILKPVPEMQEDPKGGRQMEVKGWAIAAGIGAAAGAVAILSMPRTNPARRLAAKAANKAQDVAWKVEDKVGSLTDELDL